MGIVLKRVGIIGDWVRMRGDPAPAWALRKRPVLHAESYATRYLISFDSKNAMSVIHSLRRSVG
jgi:hypothetical protein